MYTRCGIILQQRVFFLFCTRAGRRAPGWLPTSSRSAAGVRAWKPNSLGLRGGEREPGAGGFEKNERCTGYLIALFACEASYLICLEFRGRFTLFDTKIRISVNEICQNCENLILKRPADAYCSR